MDRLDELAVLVAIVEEGSLARAAIRLRLSPPSVTRALAALEARTGARLVERTTRRLAVTDAGRGLASRARTLLSGYEASLLGAADDPVRGLVRVTAPVQFGRLHVAPVVSSFLDAFTSARIELLLHDRNQDLFAKGLDVALRIGHLPVSGLVAKRVGEVRRVVVAAPAYLARRGVPGTPAELAGHDTVFGMARTGGREWHFGADQTGDTVRLEPRLIVNDVEAQLVAVRAGCGVARVLSYQAADDLASGSLVRLLAPFEPPPLPVQLVVAGTTNMAARVRAFLDHATAALKRLHVIRRMDDG